VGDTTAVGEGEIISPVGGEADGVGVTESDGEADGVGDTESEGEEEGVDVTEFDGEEEGVGVIESDGEEDSVGVIESDGEAEGIGVIVAIESGVTCTTRGSSMIRSCNGAAIVGFTENRNKRILIYMLFISQKIHL